MRIAIADDEEKIRLGLAKMIQKASSAYVIAGMYSGGAACLEALEAAMPDVIITDIRMPGMDGLELAKSLKNRAPHIKCVILSGFSDFEYARTAIVSGVSAYLLKPVDKRELFELLQDIYTQWTEKQQDAKQHKAGETSMELTLGELSPQQAEAYVAAKLPFQAQASECAVACITAEPTIARHAIENRFRHPAVKHLEYMTVEEHRTVLLIVFHSEALERMDVVQVLGHELQRQLLFEKGDIRAAMSRVAAEAGGWPEAYRQSSEGAEYQFYRNGSKLVTLPDEVRFGQVHQLERVRRKLLDSLEIIDAPAVYGHLEELLQSSAEIKVRLQHFTEMVETIFYAIYSVGTQLGMEPAKLPRYDWKQLIGQCRTFDEAARLIRSRFHQNVAVVSSARDGGGSRSVYLVKQIIEKEYAEPLDLNQLAQRVYLTPSYLSRLFKQVTGMTLIDYMIMTRIAKAKQLLKESLHLKTYQIGEQVGYKDPAYFHKQFKKITGMTPKDYQNKHMLTDVN